MLRGRNFTKPFSIGGLILGEIYMLLTVLAPYRQGPKLPIRVHIPPEGPPPADLAEPLWHLAVKIATSGVLFGLFGALVGLGLGLFVTGLLAKRSPDANLR